MLGGWRSRDGSRCGAQGDGRRQPGWVSGTTSCGRNGSHKQAKPSAHEGGLVGWLGKIGQSGMVMMEKIGKKGGNKTKSKKGK